MRIAKAIGTVVSTQKEPALTGTKFLLVQFVDAQGDLTSHYEVAADTVGAGLDEWVLVSLGSGSRQIRDGEHRPIDASVVAIIDTVTIGNQFLYSKRLQSR
jgi:carbon dioxide concentrating mechanism protein CcmL